MQCDVVIPTYNNASVLPLTIAALAAQELPADVKLKVLFADDGSRDNTVSVIKASCAKYKLPYQVLPGTHAGSAAARNRGIAATTGDVVVLIGADILLRPQCIAAHSKFHKENPSSQVGALGFVIWDPRLKPTPLMEWLTHGGPQNNYDALLGRSVVPIQKFLYGSHLSFKRSLLIENNFAEDFTQYGWEDIELGERLGKEKVALHSLATAVGLHRHRYTARDVIRRQFAVGQSLHVYEKLHPGSQKRMPFKRKIKHRLIHMSGLGAMLRLALHSVAPYYTVSWLFSKATTHFFVLGYLKRK